MYVYKINFYDIIKLTTTIQKVLLLKSPLVFRRGYTRGL